MSKTPAASSSVRAPQGTVHAPLPVSVRGVRAELLTIPRGGRLAVDGAKRFLAIANDGAHWCHPHWGNSLAQLPPGCQCLVMESTAKKIGIIVIIPVVSHHSGGVSAKLSGYADGPAHGVIADVAHADDPRVSTVQVAVAEAPKGVHAAKLIQSLVAALGQQLSTFVPRCAKTIPAWIESFGWCTWDSFSPYRNVTATGVRQGLQAFAKAGQVPPVVILDDGWQDTEPALPEWGGFLRSLGTQSERFAEGLAPVVADARAQGVRIFGVWHTLEGYWEGPQPGSALASEYQVATTTHGSPKPGSGQSTAAAGAIPPQQIARFFQDYHRRLADAGVGLVKVDNQGSLANHLAGVAPVVQASRTYQEALGGSVAVHLSGNLLTCMAMHPLVWFHLKTGTVVRNSTDYMPHDDGSHQPHLVNNGYNALFSSAFAIPDWDCFWSGHAAGAFHAAARAISGGPVYVSDKPGAFDRNILRKLIAADGAVLRPQRPAVPVERHLFDNPKTQAKPLAVQTCHHGVGTIGVFHCHPEQQSMSATVQPSDISDLPRTATYALHLHHADSTQVLRPKQSAEFSLAWRSTEIATVSPIIDGIAPFGSLDHYHSAGFILGRERLTSHTTRIQLACGAKRLAVWCAKRPKTIALNGKKIPASRLRYDRTSKLLVIACAAITTPAQLDITTK